MVLAAPVFAIAVQRNGDWTLQLSRTVAWQTLSFAATLLYAAAMLLATSAIAAFGGENARVLQTAFVFGSTAAVLTLLSSPWLKAWAKVKLAKHFFRHRYDYRAEWVRFTATLGKPDDAAPLDQRIVKAVADLTDSPAGLLLVPDGVGLGIGAGWNWDLAGLPTSGGDESLARLSRQQRPDRRTRHRPRRYRGPGRDRERAVLDAPHRCLGAGAAGPFRPAAGRDPARAPAGRPRARLGGFRPAPHRRAPGRELSRRGARPGGPVRRAALRRVQPPLCLHHARHQEFGEPIDPCRPQRRTPRRQSRIPRRHDRDAPGFGGPDERSARPPVAASFAAGPRSCARSSCCRSPNASPPAAAPSIRSR